MQWETSYDWELEHLGEAHIYPGHPIVSACLIMERYPNLDAAKHMREGATYPAALGDGFIPGAGDAVYAALKVLELACEGKLEAAHAHAKRYWNDWEAQSPAHNAVNAEKGRSQCAKLTPLFEARLKSWGTSEDPGSPYRRAA